MGRDLIKVKISLSSVLSGIVQWLNWLCFLISGSMTFSNGIKLHSFYPSFDMARENSMEVFKIIHTCTCIW